MIPGMPAGDAHLLPPGRLEERLADAHPLLSEGEAAAEAARCLYCFDAPCIPACPTAIDIPTFIHKIATKNLAGSARTILEANLLGASCARVCPVEVLCEGACVYVPWGRPAISIGRLQRYAIEKGGSPALLPRRAASGRSVGLVGSGPASLACAGALALLGHEAVVYEKDRIPGGLNTTGVAPYKIHVADTLREVEFLRSLGVRIRTGVEVGRDVHPGELLRIHDAVFLGVGLGADLPLAVPGAEGPGVVGALEWIRRMKLDPQASVAGVKRAAVIGGGNTAIDVARELARLGVPEVRLVYRRSAAEMAAYGHEWLAGEGGRRRPDPQRARQGDRAASRRARRAGAGAPRAPAPRRREGREADERGARGDPGRQGRRRDRPLADAGVRGADPRRLAGRVGPHPRRPRHRSHREPARLRRRRRGERRPGGRPRRRGRTEGRARDRRAAPGRRHGPRGPAVAPPARGAGGRRRLKARKKPLYGVHPGVRMVQDWIEALPAKTGRSLEAWLALVKKEGPKDEAARRAWLKEEHGLGTNSAWWLAERAGGPRDGGQRPGGVPRGRRAVRRGAVRGQEGRAEADLRPAPAPRPGPRKDAMACPCQTIVPLYRAHVFAEIKPSTLTRVDLGLALKDAKTPKRLVDTGGFAKKDRITRRIPIASVDEIDAEVERWIRKAYEMDG
jgi:glutamate synthase (NADPH/NADH) small chain